MLNVLEEIYIYIEAGFPIVLIVGLGLIGIGTFIYANLPRTNRVECPNCHKQAAEYARRLIDFDQGPLPKNSQAMEGSHIVASIREQVEVRFACKKCGTRFERMITQTR